MEEVEVKDVVAILIKDPQVDVNRRRFCLELISQTDYRQLDHRYSNEAITAYDLFLNVLSKWVSSQEKPLLTTVLSVLDECGLVNVAGKRNRNG
jgi:hypothetical protein